MSSQFVYKISANLACEQAPDCVIICTMLFRFLSFFFFLFLFCLQSLTGNEDKNSEVKHILYEGVVARYLQFLPETHHGGVCLRTELFGVKLKPGEYRFISYNISMA